MFQPVIKEIIIELAIKYKYPVETIEKIIKSYSYLVREVMRSGNIPERRVYNIRIPYWGLFCCKPGRLENWEKNDYTKRKTNRNSAENLSGNITERCEQTDSVQG